MNSVIHKPQKPILMNTCSAFRFGILFILSFFFLPAVLPIASAQDRPAQTDQNNYPMVTVPGTETRTFYSQILNQEMILFIKLPATYYKDTAKVYPCLYVTDANRAFPMVANIADFFEVPLVVEPEIIIIGIAYKIIDMADWGVWRTRDLTPTNVPAADIYWSNLFSGITGRQVEAKTGGAPKFLEFISKEVFPFVESNYRASHTGRGIGGYSFGGLFSLYVLFKHPELFSIYFAGSPSIKYNGGILYQYEKEYASAHSDLNAQLFMSAGSAEDSIMVANVKKMAAQLESRNYPGLKLTTHIFPGENHQTCIPAAFMKAFRVLYYKN
jgi:hypothetical protein